MRVRNLVPLGLVAICAVGLTACGGGERQDEDEAEGEFPVEITAAEFPTQQRLAETSDLVLTIENTGDETIPDLAVTVFTDGDRDPATTTGEAADPAQGADDAQVEGADPEDLGAEVDRALEEELEGELGQQEATPEDGEDGEGDTEGETVEDEDLPKSDGAFSVRSEQPGLAIPSRPVWILEQSYPRLVGAETATPPPGELSGSSGNEAVQTNTFAFGELEPGESAEIVWRVTPVQPGTYTVRYRLAAGLQGKAVAVTDGGSVPEGEFVVQISAKPPQTRVNDAGEVVPIKPGDIIGQAGDSDQQAELGQDPEISTSP